MTDVTLSGPASACKAAHIAPAVFPTKIVDLESMPPKVSSIAPRVCPDELAAVVTTLADFGERPEPFSACNVPVDAS